MSFDGIAPHYRWMERITAGSLLQRCRTRFIGEIREARDILLLGEGRGRFLNELLRINPHARVTCLDASRRMLDLMALELPDRLRPSSSSSEVHVCRWVHFLHADILTVSPRELTALPAHRPPEPQSIRSSGGEDRGAGEPTATCEARFDAVASHFFLDCFTPEQVERICMTVAASVLPGARWLISDFCLPDRGWQRLRGRWIIWLMYRFFRVVTRLPAKRLTAPDRLLERAGFRLKGRGRSNHGLLHSDVWMKA